MNSRIKDLLLVAAVLTSGFLLAERAVAGNQGGGGDEDQGLIAVTGTYGSSAAALYLIDSKTRNMAVYRVESGRGLEFIAARDCTYDFYLESYRDRTDPAFQAPRLRRAWEKHLRKGGTTPGMTEQEAQEAAGDANRTTLPGGRKAGPDVRPVEPGGGGGR